MSTTDEAWDALWETMAARCCDCPSCNHYLPPGEFKPESKCVLVAAIEGIVAEALEEAANSLLRSRVTNRTEAAAWLQGRAATWHAEATS